MTLTNDTGFHDAAGRFTSEGYALTVDDRGIVLAGASALGAWWGTRSVLQAAAAGNSTLARGRRDRRAWMGHAWSYGE